MKTTVMTVCYVSKQKCVHRNALIMEVYGAFITIVKTQLSANGFAYEKLKYKSKLFSHRLR